MYVYCTIFITSYPFQVIYMHNCTNISHVLSLLSHIHVYLYHYIMFCQVIHMYKRVFSITYFSQFTVTSNVLYRDEAVTINMSQHRFIDRSVSISQQHKENK